MQFYTSIFKKSKILDVTHYEKNSSMPEGTVSSVAFQLDGKDFTAINGGPEFTYSEAISFIVNCNTQNKLDEFVTRLSDGGQIQKGGWLIDKFGVCWHIVPSLLDKMLQDKEKADRIMRAILKMRKIDIETLKETYNKQVQIV